MSELLRMDQCPMSDRCELVIEAEKEVLWDLLAFHLRLHHEYRGLLPVINQQDD